MCFTGLKGVVAFADQPLSWNVPSLSEDLQITIKTLLSSRSSNVTSNDGDFLAALAKQVLGSGIATAKVISVNTVFG